MESKEKLIEDNINGMIAAFGDFDSDRFTDVFVITENGKSFELFRAFPSEPVLRKSSIKCSFNGSDETIVGVIASDFSGKAMMDVLVVTTKSIDSHLFNIYLFKGSINVLECNNISKPLIANALSHPFVLDFNGDMISDFIVKTKDCDRELWTRFGYNSIQGDNCQNVLNKDKQLKTRFPHSNAFINLDPFSVDLSTDIFISGETSMEYWHNQNGFSTQHLVHLPIPKSSDGKSQLFVGQSAFIDINIDGLIDHILPVCRKEGDLCIEPQIMGLDIKKKEWIVISNLNQDNISLSFTEIKTYGQLMPIALRPGDVDGDGYIDLITIMKSENKLKAKILKNKNSKDPKNGFGRQFVIDDWDSDKYIEKEANVINVAFIDLFEDGKLDILMTTKTTKDKNELLSVVPVVNTQMVAACFLKIIVTSGLCYGSNCPKNGIPYGTNQFGPFVCYQLQDLDGKWQTGCAGQLSQSGHTALQIPYSVFGLGETPNFVENVYAAIPSGNMKFDSWAHTRHSKWTQIVPDAQVVLIPFPPNDTNNWISKLFYTPSNIVFSTLITLAAICCLLVLIIGILHRKELLEDLAEHEEYKRNWIESR